MRVGRARPHAAQAAHATRAAHAAATGNAATLLRVLIIAALLHGIIAPASPPPSPPFPSPPPSPPSPPPAPPNPPPSPPAPPPSPPPSLLCTPSSGQSQTCVSTSKFNNNAVTPGNIMYFTLIFKPSYNNPPVSTISLTNGMLTVTASDGTTQTVSTPDSYVTLDSSVTSYNLAQWSGSSWSNTAPLAGSGNTFLAVHAVAATYNFASGSGAW